ncbi:MAG: hypothetical protein Tp172MES00d2C118481931_29 [Prokaryotic dsDNA virus sp.]|nr:MAG: hypothetical protein Tp172MES00d2C118481931_29 [Prokaryotic dsDNA virus sp.]|tara:strand:- start:15065 stop:15325 length:261 start_codon:yes stop_codon:yes gene_type:complete
MSIIRRIWDVYTNSAQEELLLMLEEFAFDYSFDDRFLSAVGQMEDAIFDMDYERLRLLFEKFAPKLISNVDMQLFYEIIDEADYGY